MNRELRSLSACFRAAFSGIRCCICDERNLRIHLSTVLGVMLISRFYAFTALHYAVLTLIFAMMIAVEMLNTAIERVVDLESPSYHRLAKMAKDIAAGATLVCAIAAVVIGVLFFCDIDGIRRLLDFMRERTVLFLSCAAGYCLLAFSFIFLPGSRR